MNTVDKNKLILNKQLLVRVKYGQKRLLNSLASSEVFTKGAFC